MPDTNKTYAGFTIGPIYDVLSHSKRTRELWFASYFFSWFMEKMVTTLDKNEGINFLTPYVDKSSGSQPSRAGKYHDRFVLESSLDPETLFEIIKNTSEGILDEFVDIIDKVIGKNNYINGNSRDNVKQILSPYVQRNFIVLGSEHVTQDEPVKSIDGFLDAMEENRIFTSGSVSPTCFRCKTLKAVAKRKTTEREDIEKTRKSRNFCPLCFTKLFCHQSEAVIEKIDPENKNPFQYPSITRIAAREFFDMKGVDTFIKTHKEFFEKKEDLEFNEDDLDFKDIEDIIKYFNQKEKREESIKKYYKYVAIVQADGDNMGKVARKMKEPQTLSKKLFDFAQKAEDLVKSYKGEPIYIGGDDLLAFMPVAFKDSEGQFKTVFDFATDLSSLYKKVIDGATISVGMNIVYYKFPLSAALENARNQLFVKAKKDYGRNALALRLTKHSGHQIECNFTFDTDEITHFASLLSSVLSEAIELPHSIHHNLGRTVKVLASLSEPDRLSAFFENNFNEPEHSRFEEGLKRVQELFVHKGLPSKKNIKEKEKDINDILNKLSFIKFLRSENQ
jgi:CRISPR-associated protein Cmr2